MTDQLINIATALTVVIVFAVGGFIAVQAITGQLRGRGAVRWDGLLFAAAVMILGLLAISDYPAALMRSFTDGLRKVRAESPAFRAELRAILEPVAEELGGARREVEPPPLATPDWAEEVDVEPVATVTPDPNAGGGEPVPTPTPAPVIEPTPAPPCMVTLETGQEVTCEAAATIYRLMQTPSAAPAQPTPTETCVVKVGGGWMNCPPTPVPGG